MYNKGRWSKMFLKERVYEMSREGETMIKYPNVLVHKEISRRLEALGVDVSKLVFEIPPPGIEADFAIPCFQIQDGRNEKPPERAKRLTKSLRFSPSDLIAEVKAEGPYLNLRLNYERFGAEVLRGVLLMERKYGAENVGGGKVVVIDMSSPNIAKRMSFGHFPPTIIGEAIARIYDFEGYKVIRDNHIGDWGTQFGKLIQAIKTWSSEEEVARAKDPIGTLQKLYVRFHKEAKEKPELDEKAKEWFLKLEKGDPEAKRIWQLCVDVSMKEFEEVYKLLNIRFDLVRGESFYEPILPRAVKEVREKIGEISEGALVVNMEDVGLASAIVLKSDGGTVYMTRDIACAINRAEELKADEILYVVGEPQKFYFQQLFEVLKRLGYDIVDNCTHIYFGTISLPEGKMSTRAGRVILLKDVLDEAVRRAEKAIKKQNPKLSSNPKKRKEVARQVGVGAVTWQQLSQDRKRNIVFEWDKMLSFDGFSGPYVQYAHARACSILRKAKISSLRELPVGETMVVEKKVEQQLLKDLARFPEVVKDAAASHEPARIANYLFSLTQAFSRFYRDCSVLRAKNERIKNSRLRLVAATAQVINNGLQLLAIEAPQEM